MVVKDSIGSIQNLTFGHLCSSHSNSTYSPYKEEHPFRLWYNEVRQFSPTKWRCGCADQNVQDAMGSSLEKFLIPIDWVSITFPRTICLVITIIAIAITCIEFSIKKFRCLLIAIEISNSIFNSLGSYHVCCIGNGKDFMRQSRVKLPISNTTRVVFIPNFHCCTHAIPC